MDNSLMIGIGGDAPMMLGLLWGFTSVAFIFVVLRLYTRIKVVQAYGLDDHFFNASFVSLLIYDVMLTIASYYGFGQDMTGIIAAKGTVDGMENITRAILYSAIGQTVLVFGTALSKTSLALFLLRLVTTRRDQVAIWVPNFFLATAIVASLFVFWFSCVPVAYLWDRRLDGTCPIDPGHISTYAGCWSVIVDFFYAAFPWWLLWNLNMPRREKMIIGISMSLGVLAGACGIKRAIELKNLGSPNYLKDVVGIIIWHAAEFCTTLVCVGIPVCRPLYRDWFGTWMSGRRSGEDLSASGNSGWMKHKNAGGGGGGVFAMHTIGGSELKAQNNTNTSDRYERRDSRATDEQLVLRSDIHQSKQDAFAVGAAERDSGSELSILGPEHNQNASIKVTKEFQVESKTP
ncbi:hypothetical protein PFICI_14710 [Pestalotiopsis fici W106-1]|uniref:Rhodopsin domain-containing protein n=1 Tax=Pestalotiopsis fici (strain W106-1 / CGMCC3.15140) TaxID=1229662 RepID=W3WJ31_PESFW|nr:uncharacterized protein PFICI_14710 [Pestalotiopsis fici W106-1]ETS73764.1 hypothetical protein PFICI_14710 [Pestalotiopsis fici W106-1]